MRSACFTMIGAKRLGRYICEWKLRDLPLRSTRATTAILPTGPRTSMLALAGVFVLLLAADIGFVRFNDGTGAAKRSGRLMSSSGLPEPMEQKPRRLVIGPERPLQLQRAKPFLARRHELSGENPFRQRNVRAFHHGPDRHRERLAAVFALVEARARALTLHQV